MRNPYRRFVWLPRIIAATAMLLTGPAATTLAPLRGNGQYLHAVSSGRSGVYRVLITDNDDGLVLNPALLTQFDATQINFTKSVFFDDDGDGIKDVVLAPGPGQAPPTVRIFDLAGTLLRSFDAFQPTWNGGVGLGAGNVVGNRTAELLTTTQTQFAQVNFFRAGGGQGGFLAPFPGDTSGLFAHGLQILPGGKDELMLVPGPGRSDIRFFDARGTEVIEGGFHPLGEKHRDGFVTAIAQTLEGLAIVIGTATPRPAEFVIFRIQQKVLGSSSDARGVGTGASADEVFELINTIRPRLGNRGVVLATGDLDGDGTDEIFVGSKAKRRKSIKIFRLDGTLVASFAPFPSATALTDIAVAPLDS